MPVSGVVGTRPQLADYVVERLEKTALTRIARRLDRAGSVGSESDDEALFGQGTH